jgi:hypothetical protein
LINKNNIWSGGFPWKQGWKTAADIGRVASKHVKVTVSGKNILHSSTPPAKPCSATLKKAKPTETASAEKMNHTNDKEMVKDEVEAMDTQEGGSLNLKYILAPKRPSLGSRFFNSAPFIHPIICKSSLILLYF